MSSDSAEDRVEIDATNRVYSVHSFANTVLLASRADVSCKISGLLLSPTCPSLLYLIHQLYGDIYGSWREGRIRAIGVSNFHPDRVMDLMMHHEVIPAVDQIETHPFHQQVEAQKFLRENSIQIDSWGSFAEGRNDIFHNVLRSIAENHRKRRPGDRALVDATCRRGDPEFVRKERMAENLNVFDFELTRTR